MIAHRIACAGPSGASLLSFGSFNSDASGSETGPSRTTSSSIVNGPSSPPRQHQRTHPQHASAGLSDPPQPFPALTLVVATRGTLKDFSPATLLTFIIGNCYSAGIIQALQLLAWTHMSQRFSTDLKSRRDLSTRQRADYFNAKMQLEWMVPGVRDETCGPNLPSSMRWHPFSA